MTLYIAAYDTESPACLEAVRRIVRMHEKHAMPATFFIVAQLLDANEAEYVALLKDNPLFEIASHSYTHMVLRDTPEFGKAGPVEQFPREIIESKRRLEDAFEREVIGFRAPVSFVDGMKSAPDALRLLAEAGYRYVSSLAWGPSWSLPALLVRPFTYAEEEYPNLWELPPAAGTRTCSKATTTAARFESVCFRPRCPRRSRPVTSKRPKRSLLTITSRLSTKPWRTTCRR